MTEKLTEFSLEFSELDAVRQRLALALEQLHSLTGRLYSDEHVQAELDQMILMGETYRSFMQGLINSDRSSMDARARSNCQVMLLSVTRFPAHVVEVVAALRMAG